MQVNATPKAAPAAVSEPPYPVIHREMPNPTTDDLISPRFEAIWRVIQSWDVNVPECYTGYCGANGSHVKMILDALAAAPASQGAPKPVAEDLRALVQRLVRALRKSEPGHLLPGQAMAYLERSGLSPSPLRDGAQAAGQEQPGAMYRGKSAEDWCALYELTKANAKEKPNE